MSSCLSWPRGVEGVAGGVMGGAAVGAGPLSAANEDSKDSSGHKEEAAPKVTVTDEPWYYDELDLHAMDGFDEPDPDSDYDYEEPYPKRKKKRAVFGKPRGGNLAAPTDSPHPRKPKAQGPGRGRKKGMVYADLQMQTNLSPVTSAARATRHGRDSPITTRTRTRSRALAEGPWRGPGAVWVGRQVTRRQAARHCLRLRPPTPPTSRTRAPTQPPHKAKVGPSFRTVISPSLTPPVRTLALSSFFFFLTHLFFAFCLLIHLLSMVYWFLSVY
ncbi:uncharacterized protein LOC111061994 [Nilaparvata lugens]|uniref:uncharacterized protein LOC111061994 n=1 Tax=Nilaparvata lugens TaxID=108931 RepID=UPI00193CFD99|nr:uncharacterized protein LOC111061994 [Nilaparvata lugens]